MKRAYHDLMEQISVPSGLNDRVLQAVRQEAAGVGTRWKRTALRAAVCAACALALVLGTVRLAPRSAEEPGLPQLTYSFGLTAYAADIGETIVPNANGGLALRSGTGIWDPLQGYFTGCLFQVTGENLQKVTLSVDRGGLYRSETRKATVPGSRPPAAPDPVSPRKKVPAAANGTGADPRSGSALCG